MCIYDEANQQNDFSSTFHYYLNKKTMNKENEKKIFKTLVANLWSINKSQDEEVYILLLRTLNDFQVPKSLQVFLKTQVQ